MNPWASAIMIILFTLALALAVPLVTWIIRKTARSRQPVVVFSGTYFDAVRMQECVESAHIPAVVHLNDGPPPGMASVFVAPERVNDARRLLSGANDGSPETD